MAGGVNLYAYAGGNPVAFSDPYGLSPDTLKINGTFSQRAVGWLMNHSPTVRRTIERMAADRSVSVTVRDARSALEAYNGNSFTATGPQSGVIIVSPIGTDQANFDLALTGNDKKWIHTVATDLAHELGHAAGHLGQLPPQCAGDPPTGKSGCIIAFENKIRQELGGSAGLRAEY